MGRRRILLALALALCFLGACRQGGAEEHEGGGRRLQSEMEYALWVAYWDREDLRAELRLVEGRVQTLSHFAAYFDAERGLFLAEESRESFQQLSKRAPEGQPRHYISYVNDLLLEEGGASLKDRALLYELLSEDGARERHCQEIIALAQREGFDGIEIDYEGMRDDLALWQLFLKLIEQLYAESQSQGLSLRVLLEPNAPLEDIALPAGPQYVLMCYNLHGSGTAPGPKADGAFLEAMLEKSAHIPGETDFALASGGYDFASDGQVQALTERACRERLALCGAAAKRDGESRALRFSYTDAQGIGHEIWYADKETLRHWIGILQAGGQRKISLWKLGGNIELDAALP